MTDVLKKVALVVSRSLEASNAKFDVSALTYETANQSSDSANVKVSGKLTIVSAAGTSRSGEFPVMTLQMKNESGWKVCGMSR